MPRMFARTYRQCEFETRERWRVHVPGGEGLARLCCLSDGLFEVVEGIVGGEEAGVGADVGGPVLVLGEAVAHGLDVSIGK